MRIERTFIPGSKWLYVKIYAGIKTCDDILTKDIGFIVTKLKKERVIKEWFFIRYMDPNPHLRVRFLLNDNREFTNVISLLYKRFEKQIGFSIWKIQFDTYTRELERYGKVAIEESESLFHLDSCCILSIIKRINKEKNEGNLRWIACLKLLDNLMNDFHLEDPQKLVLLMKISEDFKKEFGFGKNIEIFKSKYRTHSAIIKNVITGNFIGPMFETIYRHLAKKSKLTVPIVDQLVAKINKSKDPSMLTKIISSHMHMSVNRLFITKNRHYELIIYDFLYNYYKSKLARERKNTQLK